MANNKTILYSTRCPRCRIITSKLKANHIEFTINSDTEEMRSKGFTEVPMLQLDDGTILNFREAINWFRKYDVVRSYRNHQIESINEEQEIINNNGNDEEDNITAKDPINNEEE